MVDMFKKGLGFFTGALCGIRIAHSFQVYGLNDFKLVVAAYVILGIIGALAGYAYVESAEDQIGEIVAIVILWGILLMVTPIFGAGIALIVIIFGILKGLFGLYASWLIIFICICILSAILPYIPTRKK